MSPRVATSGPGSRAGAFFRRCFAERQLILRQNDSVVAVRIAPTLQMAMFGALVIGAAWTATATGAFLGGRNTLTEPVVAEWVVAEPVVAETVAQGTAALVEDADEPTAATEPPAIAVEQAAATETPAIPIAQPASTVVAQPAPAEIPKTAPIPAFSRIIEEAQAGWRAAIQERDRLAAHLAEAEQRLRAAASQHERALSRLTDETRRSISEVERIVGAAGLDVKRLVPQRQGETAKPNRGGPFIPWTRVKPAPLAPPTDSAEAVSNDIARLDALLQLLRTMPLGAPVSDFTITSPFGYRLDPFNGEGALHEGIDLQARLDSPIAASAPGRVTFAGWQQGYGRMVEIDHGNNIRTRYAHLDKINVREGDRVQLKQTIGLLGGSGRASGPHLHYEVLVDGQAHDPLNFMKAASNVRKNQ